MLAMTTEEMFIVFIREQVMRCQGKMLEKYVKAGFTIFTPKPLEAIFI